jgi:hypothetical protein
MSFRFALAVAVLVVALVSTDALIHRISHPHGHGNRNHHGRVPAFENCNFSNVAMISSPSFYASNKCSYNFVVPWPADNQTLLLEGFQFLAVFSKVVPRPEGLLGVLGAHQYPFKTRTVEVPFPGTVQYGGNVQPDYIQFQANFTWTKTSSRGYSCPELQEFCYVSDPSVSTSTTTTTTPI